jgi:hypothetical protein
LHLIEKKRMTSAMKTRFLTIAALAWSAFSVPALAQERILTIYGQDACPSNTICVTRPEGERYRIPKELRSGSVKPTNQSWAVRSQATINEGSSAPSSCTNVGAAGGWNGCWAEEMRKARASAKEDRDAEKVLP